MNFKHQTQQNMELNCRKNELNKMRREGGDVNLLVDLDADGALGDVPDLAGASVVELVGHALVDGAVNLDVHVVPDLVRPQVRRQRYIPLLPERSREEVARARSETVTRRHLGELSCC